MRFRLFDDSAIDAHLRALSAQSSQPAPRRQPKVKSPMFFGTVNHLSAAGYGFITADAPIDGIVDRESIYFHRAPKGVIVERGDRVEFTLKPAKLAGRQPETLSAASSKQRRRRDV
jgi:hypothetical protein